LRVAGTGGKLSLGGEVERALPARGSEFLRELRGGEICSEGRGVIDKPKDSERSRGEGAGEG